MKKKYKGWAVFGPDGFCYLNTIAASKEGAIKLSRLKMQEMQKHGYTCEPVTITQNTPDTPESTP